MTESTPTWRAHIRTNLSPVARGNVEARADKSYSLCDALSFVLMRDRSIQQALTTDRHFTQEGFGRLLEP
jgi:predicted nucleic acid-binding protein